MPIETYSQALDFWFSRVNYEQRGMPADLTELKLDRMRAMLDQLGNPEKQLRIIHVAGSKGKGSTSAMLASILQQAGYRTGLFTSPHLCHVEERCQINGQPISPEHLTSLMRGIEPVVRSVEVTEQFPPTFFEIVTAVGFLHFARQQTDFAVMEVGLGGRFDSTNVCTPLVSVITSISFDHTQQLGDHLAAIAREKAGIIKPVRPVVSGVTAAEARPVIEQVASKLGSPLVQLQRDFDFAYHPGQVTSEQSQPAQADVRTSRSQRSGLVVGLLGEHQAANAAVAIACVEQLQAQGVNISEEAISAGLRDVHWPARMEVVGRRPLVVLDCAHNVASIQALIDTLQCSFPSTRRILVFACSGDKDIAGMLALLVPNFQQAYFTRYAGSTRGAPPENLAALWKQLGGGDCHICSMPAKAWKAARQSANADDLICITGSVFLAGELRPSLV